MQSFLGDDKDSRIAVLSDRAEATFRITFADAKHEPIEILMEEFIDEKSAKAKGKRVTTLEVASIEDVTPEPEPEQEPEPGQESEPEETDTSDNPEPSDNPDTPDSLENPETPGSIDVEGVPMTFEKPADTQLDLF